MAGSLLIKLVLFGYINFNIAEQAKAADRYGAAGK
jgi:hypothetical protein